jgi:AcrR family transcriptional regulator
VAARRQAVVRKASAPASVAAEPSLVLRSVDRAMARRRATYEDEARRLVAASFELARETGQLEPRVGEIVARAGLSNQAFYKHFRSKDELLLAVLDDGIRILRGYLEHRMAKIRSPRTRVRQWVAGVVEQALDPESAAATRPFALSRVRLAELFPEEVRRSEAQLSEMLMEAIVDAQAAGELAAGDARRDAELVYDLSMSWIERKLSNPTPPRRSDGEHLIEFAMRGLQHGSAAQKRRQG